MHISMSLEQTRTLKGHLDLYRHCLFDSVIPFWEKYSLDSVHGGYHTCLEHDGTVYDTDKFLWMQAREVWCFSHLCNRYGKRPSWLDAARLGADFIRAHGMDDTGAWYFSVDDEGRPLVAPYNIYADCFALMALAEYSAASGDKDAMDLALRTYRRVQERKDNPKGRYEKLVSGSRRFHAFGFSMIQINMARVLGQFDPSPIYDERIDEEIRTIVDLHIDGKRKMVLERVALDGQVHHCMEERLLCPGHACEVIWFLAQIAVERNDKALLSQLTEALVWTLDGGWDRRYGGIYYYRDAKGYPTEKVESDMKLWWVHLEALYATLCLFSATGDERMFSWYKRIFDWTWPRFNDDSEGEWFGYLYRDGTVAKTLKGGKWKGMFHLPRALMESIGTIETLLGEGGAV